MGQTYTKTVKGIELARELRRFTKTNPDTDGMDETCSRIGRLAASHSRLAERACSVEMTEKQQARHDKEDTRIETLISSLVATLPPVKVGRKALPLGVEFQGDPRGFTVKIKIPDALPGAHRQGNTWGLGGLYGI